MRAIQISAFGKLTEVLKLVDIPEPAAPASGEALIGVEFAPINQCEGR
jgi:NADPH:quinone reductase-like Zn-dependent oxidoreductase